MNKWEAETMSEQGNIAYPFFITKVFHHEILF